MTTFNGVYIAVPVYDGYIHHRLADALVYWAQTVDYVHTVRFFKFHARTSVDVARNQIVQSFMASTASHLLMIDDDVVPSANALEKLVSDDKDIVSGAYPGTMRPVLPPYLRAVRNGEFVAGKGLEQVDYVGAGCLMVTRRVFLKMNRPWFKLEINHSRERLITPEDFYFCEAARAQGFEIWVDFDVHCEYFKTMGLRRVNDFLKNHRHANF